MQPFWRRLITRLIGVIPAATVAAAVGPAGLNTMLVASQVLLSVVLPTVIFPLVYLCSREELMTVRGPELSLSDASPPLTTSTATPSANAEGEGRQAAPRVVEKSFKSPKWLTWLGYALFSVVVVANVYVFVQLGLGQGT